MCNMVVRIGAHSNYYQSPPWFEIQRIKVEGKRFVDAPTVVAIGNSIYRSGIRTDLVPPRL
jgi:hypothetical protein